MLPVARREHVEPRLAMQSIDRSFDTGLHAALEDARVRREHDRRVRQAGFRQVDPVHRDDGPRRRLQRSRRSRCRFGLQIQRQRFGPLFDHVRNLARRRIDDSNVRETAQRAGAVRERGGIEGHRGKAGRPLVDRARVAKRRRVDRRAGERRQRGRQRRDVTRRSGPACFREPVDPDGLPRRLEVVCDSRPAIAVAGNRRAARFEVNPRQLGELGRDPPQVERRVVAVDDDEIDLRFDRRLDGHPQRHGSTARTPEMPRTSSGGLLPSSISRSSSARDGC